MAYREDLGYDPCSPDADSFRGLLGQSIKNHLAEQQRALGQRGVTRQSIDGRTQWPCAEEFSVNIPINKLLLLLEDL